MNNDAKGTVDLLMEMYTKQYEANSGRNQNEEYVIPEIEVKTKLSATKSG